MNQKPLVLHLLILASGKGLDRVDLSPMNVSVSGVESLLDHPTILLINSVPVEAEQAAEPRSPAIPVPASLL